MSSTIHFLQASPSFMEASKLRSSLESVRQLAVGMPQDDMERALDALLADLEALFAGPRGGSG